MNNIPEVKVGIVAVSRDCFPESLSVNRREALVKAYTDKYGAADIYECPICIVVTLDRRSPRHCLQNISRDRRCLLQQQRKHRTT